MFRRGGADGDVCMLGCVDVLVCLVRLEYLYSGVLGLLACFLFLSLFFFAFLSCFSVVVFLLRYTPLWRPGLLSLFALSLSLSLSLFVLLYAFPSFGSCTPCFYCALLCFHPRFVLKRMGCMALCRRVLISLRYLVILFFSCCIMMDDD